MAVGAATRDRGFMHLLCGFTDSASGRHAGRVAADLAARLQADLTYEIGEHAVRLAAASQASYDLFVVGWPPRGRLRMTLGGRPTWLSGEARCPVMIVPHGAPESSAERIVLAYDMSDAARAAAATAARLAARLDVTITVVLAVPKRRRYFRLKENVEHVAIRDLQSAVNDEHVLDIAFIRRSGRPVKQLARAVVEIEPALVVVGTGKRRLWRRLFTPSVALGIARRAKQPVVIVTAPTPARVLVVDGSSHAN